MSKAVGKILMVATIAVTVATAIPTGGGSFLIGSKLAALIGAGLSAAGLVNAMLLAGKKSNQPRQAAAVSLTIGEGPRVPIMAAAYSL